MYQMDLGSALIFNDLVSSVEDDLSSEMNPSDFIVIGPCIYFLIKQDSIVYVGKTVSLHYRICTHLLGNKNTDPKDFDAVRYVKAPNEFIDRIEARFMLLIQPKYNKELNWKSGIKKMKNLAGKEWCDKFINPQRTE